MSNTNERDLEIKALFESLSRLTEASIRINKSLYLDRVLHGVLDSACTLTGALYGVIVLLDDAQNVQSYMTSGLTSEQVERIRRLADEERFFERIGGLTGTVRVGDFHNYVRQQGLSESEPPIQRNSPLPFLISPITYLGRLTGVIYLGNKASGEEFTPEDEETIVMFASQSALVIANARLRRDEQRASANLEAAFDTVPVGVLVFDAKTGLPVYFNHETRRISAYLASTEVSIEEALGVITVHRGDSEEVSLQDFPLAEALGEAGKVLSEEVVMSVPDGRSVSALLNATPIHSQEGEIESLAVTIQDTTHLEEMERLRAEFLGTVSHELRAPLSSIRGSAATLSGSWTSLDPGEVELLFRMIEQEADRMSGLITDLLDVAQMGAGSLSISPTATDLAVLIDEAKRTYLSAGGSDSLRIELSPDLPRVMADRRRIVQVLINLLSNAARQSSDAKLIEMTANKKENYIEISVTDHGRGIPAERLPHLFKKFSGADDQRGDYGLGLAICKVIVDAHGGRIRAESDGPGLGARFTFTLPIVEHSDAMSQDDSETQPVQVPESDRERSRILVVDDDPQTLWHVRSILSESGYTLNVTADPNEVPRLLREVKPHLVLLNLMLPGIDGIELMKTISDPTKAPVIFLSAYGQDEVIVRAFDAGAADYVVKPFSPTELVARIKAALRRHRALLNHDMPAQSYVMNDLVIDYAQRRVSVAGIPVELTDTEYRVLVELSTNSGRIMTHEQLVRRVWGVNNASGSAPVRVIVMRLRNKLGDRADSPTYIFTKRRVGYWMAEPGGESR